MRSSEFPAQGCRSFTLNVGFSRAERPAPHLDDLIANHISNSNTIPSYIAGYSTLRSRTFIVQPKKFTDKDFGILTITIQLPLNKSPHSHQEIQDA